MLLLIMITISYLKHHLQIHNISPIVTNNVINKISIIFIIIILRTILQLKSVLLLLFTKIIVF